MSTLKEFSEYLYHFHIKAKYDSIESLCSEAYKYFLDGLNQIDEKEFSRTRLKGDTISKRKEGLISWMEKKMEEINKIVKCKSDNALDASFDFYNLLFNDDGTIRFAKMVTLVDKATDFYRIRSAEKYKIYNRKEMFLISDKLENLVGAYRFNPSGYACLYLASNLFLSWEECRRPDFDMVNFSRFENTCDIRVLNVLIPQKMYWREEFLMTYLALLCCAKTTDKDKHNFQYIVPHLMMEALCYSQCQAKGKKKPIIHGIKYLSSRRFDQKDFLFPEKNLCEAYVFPQHPHEDTEEICPVLTNLFRLTKPRTFFLYKTHCLNFFNTTAFISTYTQSLFYQLELQTKRDKADKYNL